ncbi:hypothetical protein IFR05_006161 [Cadophora sp. M221]|nr:hypothetical protein IFR05_006161 [Cadophora sp. M221]
MERNNTSASWAMEPPQIPQQTRRYRKDEWEVHRDRIANMYPIPGVTLKAIKGMLEEDHSFVVNERQLKKKIDDWKIAKNVQSSEMTFIVYKQHQRTLARKPTTFRARGQPVNPDKIVRWQKRHGKAVENIDSPVPLTPSDISYSPASIRAPSPQVIGIADDSSYSKMDWSANANQQPGSSHVHTIVDTTSQVSEHSSFDQMLILEHTTFEGQSPAPFTPLPSPVPSPSILSSQLRNGSSSYGESSSHNQSSTSADTPSVSQDFTQPPRPVRAVHGPTNPDPLYHNDPAEPKRSRSRKTRYLEEEELELQQRLGDFQSRHGASHPATLDAMSRLACVFGSQGRLRSAESYFRKVAESYQNNFGDGDMRTIKALVDLVKILQTQCNTTPAERLCRRLYMKVSTILPAEHSMNLQIKNLLGRCLHDAGHVKEAEETYCESIKLGGYSLAPDDELLLIPMGNLAKILADRGEFAEAERLHVVILHARSESRGSKDAGTMNIRSSLGYIYLRQGRLEESEAILRQVFADQREILGAEHRDILSTQRYLASNLDSQKNHKESEELLRDALRKSDRSLGKKHIESLGCRTELVQVLNHQNRFQEAEILGKEALQFSTEALGASHCLTFFALNQLGASYEGQDRLEEALALMQVAAEGYARILGDGHRITVLYREGVLRVEQKVEQRLMAGSMLAFV